MRVEELRERWLTRREEFARLAAHVDGARIVDEFVADLQTLEHDEADKLLSLSQASQLSGYTSEHIARLVRQGSVINYGRKGKPLVRRGDLPQKPKRALASDNASPYDAAADARSLLSRQGGRNDGASKP
ncbi:MAG TPA: hypothetical protein VHB25_12825 [Gemmatimonadaceae bacterium]|nr:hypothetical protein [Gemmatimonadaceae bacterium]